MSRYSIESLLCSLKNPVEIIVVDNGGSFDDSIYFLKLCEEKRITHYIRNADNLNFCYGYNQALKLAWGDYFVLASNDLHYQREWLEACLKVFEHYPDDKLIVSPLDYPTNILRQKYHQGTINVAGKDFKLSMRAGSNCFVMKRSTYEEIGEFDLDPMAGSKYTDRLVRAGYLTAVPPTNMAIDLGLRRGFDFKTPFEFKKTLTDGTTIAL